MEFKRFMDLLQDKGIKLVYMESHKELVEWNPELEDTYNVFAEKDGKTVMLESDETVKVAKTNYKGFKKNVTVESLRHSYMLTSKNGRKASVSKRTGRFTAY